MLVNVTQLRIEDNTLIFNPPIIMETFYKKEDVKSMFCNLETGDNNIVFFPDINNNSEDIDISFRCSECQEVIMKNEQFFIAMPTMSIYCLGCVEEWFNPETLLLQQNKKREN